MWSLDRNFPSHGKPFSAYGTFARLASNQWSQHFYFPLERLIINLLRRICSFSNQKKIAFY